MLVKGPQPPLGAREESERRHDDDGNAVQEQSEPRADEAHIVIERQPAHADIGRAELHGLADGAHIGEQVGVREDDALGASGRAGGVLQQRDVTGLARAAAGEMKRKSAGSRRGRFLGGFDEFFRVRNKGEGRHARLQQLGHGLGPPKCEEKADFGILQNGGLTGRVFLDAIGAERRIDGYGNGPGKENSRVGDEERA